jgi:SAM-dependent methyltransferase
MSVATSGPTIAELIDSFAEAGPDRLSAEFHRLVAALWSSGHLTEQALPAIPALLARLDQLDDQRQGYLMILLGLLSEAEYPVTDGPVTTAVRAGLGRYLDLLERVPADQPLSLALRYLLAHFPADRDRILPAASGLDLDPDDRSRLERALDSLDRAAPSLGRVFPSPAVWTLEDDEREFDQGWIKALTSEQVVENWRKDTRMVFGHAGAKAYWAVCNGEPPVPVVYGEMPSRDSLPRTAAPDDDLFSPHAAAFRCPDCGGGMTFDPQLAHCTGCTAQYAIVGGVLDLTAATGADADRVGDFQFKLAEMPSMGFFYEAYARPNFLRISGSNWGGAVTPADEDAYIISHLRPVAGPVLDLAAGAGRWTEVVAAAVGTDRLIALDLNPPMLTVLRGRLPQVPAVMASAATLPFGDATLGAVLCWNALQAFPDDAAAAIAEAGRCLRPGGTLTLMTFRRGDDPVYHHFQAAHHFPQHQNGLRLFEVADLERWIAQAGLTIRDQSTPGTFVFITAQRPR